MLREEVSVSEIVFVWEHIAHVVWCGVCRVACGLGFESVSLTVEVWIRVKAQGRDEDGVDLVIDM